ncbi:MAG: IS1595 family transposase [Patescibacteria group bacterium]
MAQKLIKGSRLPNRVVRKLIGFFALEIPAVRAAREVGANRHSAERVYDLIREAIVAECEREAPLSGEVEVDESYFGGHRKGNRGRGAAGKVAVFGLLKRNGRVYTRPVPDVSRAILRLIIKQKVPEGSTIYSDSFRSYDGLLTDGYRHYRINHGRGEFARKKNHINGIESFWAFAKNKLRRYYGVRRSHFFLYLKEMEFRFNHRHENIEVVITKILRRESKHLD